MKRNFLSNGLDGLFDNKVRGERRGGTKREKRINLALAINHGKCYNKRHLKKSQNL